LGREREGQGGEEGTYRGWPGGNAKMRKISMDTADREPLSAINYEGQLALDPTIKKSGSAEKRSLAGGSKGKVPRRTRTMGGVGGK